MIATKGHTKDFDDNCKQYLPMMRQGFGTWREYRSYSQCVWKVEYKTNRWFCTYPIGIKSGHCKHTLGMAILRGYVDCPEEAKTFPIGWKRKRGRPRRISRPLARDAGQGKEGNGNCMCSKCMLVLYSAARRHPYCRLYTILGEGYGHTSWTFFLIQCCTVFIIQSVLLFLVKLF